MSGTVTLLQLRDSAKDRADMTGSTRIDDPQWNEYINKSKDALYDLLLAAYGSDYYANPTPTVINIITNTDTYSLPSDFYKLNLLEFKVDRDTWRELKPFSLATKNKRGYYSSRFNIDLRYKIHGNKLIIHPMPSSGAVLNLWYTPLATNLVADVDSLDGFNGWEEFIIIDVAIKAARNEETDTRDLERDRAVIVKRLEEMAENRDMAFPAKIQDVNRERFYDNDIY